MDITDIDAVLLRHNFRREGIGDMTVVWGRGRRFGRRYVAVLSRQSGMLTIVRAGPRVRSSSTLVNLTRDRLDSWVLASLR